MEKLLKKHLPILILTLCVLYIAIVNYVPGTILTGWDNLHPEFHFQLNIKRSLFSVWQEYQSLGLLGGHAHSSDILRQFVLFGLSSLLPVTILRYLSMMFMLLAGAIGAYYFIRFILTDGSHTSQSTGSDHSIETASFLGALFYLLNLSTMQTFYAPFEAFTAHFAALPWLLWTSLSYLLKPSPKNRFLLILALLFALPAAYIPTLFLVYGIALGLCALVLFLNNRTRTFFIRMLRLGLMIILVNAFWLLPFLYFTVMNAQVNLNSKINQMSTETIFLQNKEFGTIQDVALLKGFWFNNTDPDREGRFTFMLEVWRNHLSEPIILLIGYALFVIVLIGACLVGKNKHPLSRIGLVLLVFSFIALAIATPPFSWINTLFRDAVPILNQAFRFPYTKFSILAGLTYALLFAVTVNALLSFTKQIKHTEGRLHGKSHNLRGALAIPIGYLPSSVLLSLQAAVFVILLVIFSWPIFRGNLFYTKERLIIPNEYQEVFTFFKEKNPTSRIANLPQHTFWGWNFYSWGYGGSGFLWYGIPQPILDRAFDVWSVQSENYYYELSQAIYRKDTKALRRVFDKYDISWLLLDESVIYPPSPKALFYEELKALIAETPDVSIARQFGNITIYQVEGIQQKASFVYTTGKLPDTNVTQWLSEDIAYRILGPYQTSSKPNIIYPFRSLSTVKTAKENTVQVSETEKDITITTPVQIPAQSTLLAPAYLDTETVVPVRIRTVRSGNTMILEGIITTPAINVGQTVSKQQTSIRRLFVIDQNVTYPLALKINGAESIAIQNKPGDVITTLLSLTEPNVLTLTPKEGTTRQLQIPPDELRSLPMLANPRELFVSHTADRISMTFPRVTDPAFSETVPVKKFKPVENCDAFRNGFVDTQIINEDASLQLRFISDNATACTSYFAEGLPHDLGYILQVTAMNERGRPLHFWVENIDQRRGPIDTYLPSDKTLRTNTYFLPPLEQFGRSYAFHFDNIGIGNEEPVNNLKNLSYVPYPYAFASAIRVAQDVALPEKQTYELPNVVHPNESLYLVTISDPREAQSLVFSQAYDPGWKAYQITGSCNNLCMIFPFLFGKELPDHVKVNNWANGWSLQEGTEKGESERHIVIVYLPQYLQYFGTIVSLVIILFSLISYLRKRA